MNSIVETLQIKGYPDDAKLYTYLVVRYYIECYNVQIDFQTHSLEYWKENRHLLEEIQKFSQKLATEVNNQKVIN